MKKSMFIPFSLFVCQGIYAMGIELPYQENQIAIGLEERDDIGDTPLHRAVRQNQLEVVRILIETNADPNAVNNEGKRPSDYARNSWIEWLYCAVNVASDVRGMAPLTSDDEREIERYNTKSKIYNLLKRHEAPPPSLLSKLIMWFLP